MCVGFVILYSFIYDWFEYDAKFWCGYIFAQIYFEHVKKKK